MAATSAVARPAATPTRRCVLTARATAATSPRANSVDSDATAANLNALKQDADQDSSAGGGIQAIGQEAKNEQDAGALSFALQHGASNSNTPVRVDSKGDDGRVTQTNSVESDATAANLNLTKQDADQDQGGKGRGCGCDGGGIQAIGQEGQERAGRKCPLGRAAVRGVERQNTPVRVDSKGDDGSVRQSNSVDSDATAANLNALKQDADQDQSGLRWDAGDRPGGEERAGCVRGLAGGAEGCEQLEHPGACRQQGRRRPRVAVEQRRVGCDGAEHQPDQAGRRPGPGRQARRPLLRLDGIQAIGQEAKSREQDATALSAALQDAGHDKCGCPSGGNVTNSPVRVDGKGDDGSVRSVEQRRFGCDGCEPERVEAGCGSGSVGLRRDAGDRPGGEDAGCVRGLAGVRSQVASNKNTPVRVDSKGDGGDVDQSNTVDSSATAANLNLIKQDADQDQGGKDKGRTVAATVAASRRSARRPRTSRPQVPLGCAAVRGVERQHAPVRVDSKGDDGDVSAVEQRRLGCDGAERQPDRAGRRPGPVRAARSVAATRGSASRRSARRRRTSRRPVPSRSRSSRVRATRTPRCAWTAGAAAVTSSSRTASSPTRRRRT